MPRPGSRPVKAEDCASVISLQRASLPPLCVEAPPPPPPPAQPGERRGVLPARQGPGAERPRRRGQGAVPPQDLHPARVRDRFCRPRQARRGLVRVSGPRRSKGEACFSPRNFPKEPRKRAPFLCPSRTRRGQGPRAESRQGLACAQSPRAPREAGSPLAGKGTLLAPPGVSGPGQARRRSIRVDPTRMRARAPRRNSPSPTGSSDWIWLSPEHASRLLRVSYSRESAPRVLSAAISRAPVGRRDGCHGGVPAAAPPRIPATVTSPFAAAVATRNLMARTAARADGVRVPGPSGPP